MFLSSLESPETIPDNADSPSHRIKTQSFELTVPPAALSQLIQKTGYMAILLCQER